jgi:hypothetical protein
MAKTSSIERNKKRERLVKQFANRRAKLKTVVANRTISVEERFEAAAQFGVQSRAPALRDHRPGARQLSQIQALSYPAAGTWLNRPNPRHGQVELVGVADHDDRSPWGYADPHSQWPDGQEGECDRACVALAR